MEATSATQYPFNDKINLNAKAQLIEYNVNLHNSDIKTPDLFIKIGFYMYFVYLYLFLF